MNVLETSCQEQDLKVRILTNIIINQEERINNLKAQLVEARKRDIRNNLIISGIVEDIAESPSQCLDKVKDFFKTQLEISTELKIEQARRIGQNGKIDRPVLVKLSNVTDKSIIFSHVRHLKGKKNASKCLFFVNDDLDPTDAETKKQYRELVKENKEQPDEKKKMNVKFTRNRIVVDDVIVKPKVFAPTASDVLHLTDEERQAIKTVKVLEVGEHSEKNSEYVCYVQKVKTISDVQNGFYKMKIKFGDATHVSCAYHLTEAYGPYNQEGIDDGEHAAGHTILGILRKKQLSNICVYVVRWYGGVKLGNHRFEIISHLTDNTR